MSEDWQTATIREDLLAVIGRDRDEARQQEHPFDRLAQRNSLFGTLEDKFGVSISPNKRKDLFRLLIIEAIDTYNAEYSTDVEAAGALVGVTSFSKEEIQEILDRSDASAGVRSLGFDRSKMARQYVAGHILGLTTPRSIKNRERELADHLAIALWDILDKHPNQVKEVLVHLGLLPEMPIEVAKENAVRPDSANAMPDADDQEPNGSDVLESEPDTSQLGLKEPQPPPKEKAKPFKKQWLIPTAISTAVVSVAAIGLVIQRVSSNAEQDPFAPIVGSSFLVPGDCYGGELIPGKSIEQVNQIEKTLYESGQHGNYQGRRKALGVADSAITLDLAITAKPGTTVSITRFKVETDRSPAPKGVFLNYGCGAPEDVYHAVLNLDANTERGVIQQQLSPTSLHPLHMVYGDDYLKKVQEELESKPMLPLSRPFTVSGEQPGHFRLFPITAECSCKWTLQLRWEANGHHGWVEVDNDGQPFWTLSPKNLTMYRQNSDWPKKSAQRWVHN